MFRAYLWAAVVCVSVFPPTFAGMAGAHGLGDMANPVAAKDWCEYGIDDELFREPVFTINGQAVTQQKQGAHSDTPNRTPGVPGRQIQESYGKLPLYFIQNDGQMDERVKFYEKGSGHAMFFTEDGVYLSLMSGQEDRNRKSEIQNLSPNVLVVDAHSANQNPQSAIVRLVPLGANKLPKIVAEGLQQGKVNYFIGNKPEGWRANIPTYGAVVYKEIYDGIDIKFYGNNRQLEYDIIVRPGADPSQVRFAYKGIEDLRENENGDLEIVLNNGLSGSNGLPTQQKIIQRRPYVYQEIEGGRVEVAGEFRV